MVSVDNYLAERAIRERNGGKPLSGPALKRFLPWTAVPADLHAWAQAPRPG
jgi:hypothetical protein